jgi:carbamoyl-phosphate synthase large subunit
VLINSNPATIMTDPEFAARTYIEPITPEVVEKIIEKEKPDALLPTLGGQTALNTSMKLWHTGVLAKHGVRMIGAKADAIEKGENRMKFKEAMIRIGLDMPKSGIAHTMEEARRVADDIGTFPLIIRPGFTLGGTGGGIAYNREEFETIVTRGLDLSPVSEVLIDESLLGWKEFEMEVMRDCADNCVVICSIENLDPMGVHTGDSITVAPIQTLTDREYQIMRDASFAVIREIGVETGGSNIQFATHPETGRMIVIEMNPRVSRSSALASKATGFPIAKIAAKLAVGYTLDEIRNDITRETPASFEPTIDYVVTKLPRFTFEKFPTADPVLTTQMKSVGEAMAIGRTFKESMQKALRSLETGRAGLCGDGKDPVNPSKEEIVRKLSVPNAERIFWLGVAFREGFSVEEIFELTKIDPWFLRNIEEIVVAEKAGATGAALDGFHLSGFVKSLAEALRMPGASLRWNPEGESENPEMAQVKSHLRRLKGLGFSDVQIGRMLSVSQDDVRAVRKFFGIIPTYRLVDTCAAEFEAYTPYYYSTYGEENETRPSTKRKVMILGGGPNRIGQGIEFDYCCVHAAFALKEMGFETIMVNSNPETVSTDYDTSDRLYFEPLTFEDVMNIYENEQCWGVIVQLGGQTPLNLAAKLEEAGCNIIGTSPKSIELAEDRKFFAKLLDDLKLNQAPSGTAVTEDEAVAIAQRISYPVLVRPSFVLGGRAMQIVYSDDELRHYMRNAVQASPERPVLVDRFLEDAAEVDVDVISDGETTVVGAIMEHIEQAGVHSGDSACVIPAFGLSEPIKVEIMRAAKELAKALNVIGLMNIQFAVKDEILYVIEVNPRASRTVPFVSKAIGRPLAKYAAKIMASHGLKRDGVTDIKAETLQSLGFTKEIIPTHYNVKEAVFPFAKFPGIDIALGPEMKSTGEVMGIDADHAMAFAKSQMAAGNSLPLKGRIFISVGDRQKDRIASIAKEYHDLGFTLAATEGTRKAIAAAGVPSELVHKIAEGRRPNILDMMKNGEIAMIINTPNEKETRKDEVLIRSTSVSTRTPIQTTLRGARAAAHAIGSLQKNKLEVKPLQEYH